MPIISDLPDHLLVYTCTFLPLESLSRMSCVSEKTKNIVLKSFECQDPKIILKEIDNLIAQKEYNSILKAEHALWNIIYHSTNQLSIDLVNRYILLIHSYMWDLNEYNNKKFKSVRDNRISLLDASLSSLGVISSRMDLDKTYPNIVNNVNNVNNVKQNDGVKNINIDLVLERIKKVHDQSNTRHIRHIRHTEMSDIIRIIFCAYMHYKNNDHVMAYKLVKYVLDKNQDCSFAHWLMGVIEHYCFDNLANACEEYTKSIELSPKFAYPYFSLAVLFCTLTDQKADSLYKMCIALDSNHLLAQYNRTFLLEDTEAFKIYKELSTRHPTDITNYDAIAKLSLKIDNNDNNENNENKIYILRETSTIIDQAIEIDPNNAKFWYYKALIHYNFGDSQGSLKCFYRAHQLLSQNLITERKKILMANCRFWINYYFDPNDILDNLDNDGDGDDGDDDYNDYDDDGDGDGGDGGDGDGDGDGGDGDGDGND